MPMDLQTDSGIVRPGGRAHRGRRCLILVLAALLVAASKQDAAAEPSRPLPFARWAEAWATEHRGRVIASWSAEIDGARGSERIAQVRLDAEVEDVCTSKPTQESVLLIEDGGRRRYALRSARTA